MGERSLFAVDFDKTLTDPDQDEWAEAYDQEPNEDVVEATRQAYFDGATIVVWTARQWSEASQIAGWLTAHEVPFHGLQCGKGGADKYVDDKTVRPTEFVADGSAVGTVMADVEPTDEGVIVDTSFVRDN